MKIDEDLIFKQYEKIRDELVRYINSTMTQKERNDHGQNLVEIVLPYRGLISLLKMEQEERDNDRSEFLSKLETYGLTEEEFGQSCNDYFADMKSAMH